MHRIERKKKKKTVTNILSLILILCHIKQTHPLHAWLPPWHEELFVKHVNQMQSSKQLMAKSILNGCEERWPMHVILKRQSHQDTHMHSL